MALSRQLDGAKIVDMLDDAAFNFSSWGFQSCFTDVNDGSYGGVLTGILFRTLPEYYPPGSVYAHFPMLVPARVREFLTMLPESPVRKYTFTRPPVPLPVVVAQTYAEVKGLLESREVFDNGVCKRLGDVARGVELDIRLVGSVIRLSTAPC